MVRRFVNQAPMSCINCTRKLMPSLANALLMRTLVGNAVWIRPAPGMTHVSYGIAVVEMSHRGCCDYPRAE